MSQKSLLYTPPPGFYDLPYTYAFNASSLVNGNNYLNQQVYMQGGYGDFAVRRVVGLNRILNTNSTGQFQIMRASQGVYQSSNPVQALNSPELAVVPEEWYPETGQIGFDLYGINLPAVAQTAQLCFQGSRRLPGSGPMPNYPFFPKRYIYRAFGTITQTAGNQVPTITYTKIDNYDFLLYQLMIFITPSASGCGSTPGTVPSSGQCAITVYDQNQIAISNVPIMDFVYNGAPGTLFQNGALVPPLFYKRNTVLEIDFYSMLTAGLPATVAVYLIGRRLFPCS